MSAEGHDCWEDCDGGPHGCVCGNNCEPRDLERIRKVIEYTPTEARVCIDFCNAATKRVQPDGSFMSMEDADAAFSRWLAREKRGAKMLGEIVERQIEDMLRWAGMEDQIGTDDPDQQLAWERCAEMPGRIAELEEEVAALRWARNATNGWPDES